MKNHLTKNWLMWCLFTGLLAGGLSQTGLALTCSCSVGPEQNILFHLRGVATMAGSVTVRISHGDTNQTPPTILSMVGGAIVLDPQGSGTYVVDHYDCVQWAQDIPVQLKPGEPVLVEYIYEHDNRLPTYTEFKYQEGNPNPVVWFTQPSLPCLQVYEDAADENWIPEIPVFMTYNDRLRLMGLIATDDSSIGISPMGVSTEGGQPIPDNPELQNSKPIGDLCGAGGAAAQALSSSGSTTSSKAGVTPLLKNHRPTAAAGARAMPSQLNFGLGGTNAMNGEPSKARKSQKLASIERELGIKQSRGSLPEQAILKVNPQPLHFKPAATPGAKTKTSKTNNKPLSQGTANLSNSTLSPLAVQSGGQVTNGYTVAQRIGQLRWEMSLGSLGRKVTMGRLVYQANSLDATAYSPERLSLNLGSRTSLVTRDTNGYLRQVKVGASLVDIPATNGGFQVAVYPLSQVGPADPQTGFLTVSGAPTVSWNVVNPDPAPQGRIVFTRTAGTNSEVHEAQWQGVSGAAGTMTISRFGGKWTEVRDYSLAATNTQRIETISQYKNNVLQHKSREVYQQFYNWGNPGDIYEALVQRVEDPDGKALASSYIYWDQTTQGGNEIYAATYPDGYSEIIPSRVTGDAWPVVAKGGILELDQPFQDYDPDSANSRVTRTTYNVVSDTQIT